MRAHPAGPRHGELPREHPGLEAPEDLNVLSPNIWSSGVRRNELGAMILHGRSVQVLAEEFATPLFAMDETDFRQRARAYRSAFAGADVYYASKAFSCTSVLRWVDQEGLSLDVATEGELVFALAAEFPTERLLFHGNNKSVAELTHAVQVGVGRIVLDSDVEIDRLVSVVSERQVRQRVLIRVTVEVEAHTHEFIATAHEDQKFGFSLASGEGAAAVRRVLAEPSLELVGLHSHIGSQIFDTSGFEVASATGDRGT